ncbi:MAG TPA: LPS export ABC transporter permease LptF [Burkholderiaceae bacterium]|nr:LPS export ABC transporter permease LptF [Burkholderiaceae bacterium]
MLFKKALRRDLTNLAGVVFATLFTIMVTTTLIRLLGRAATGRVGTADVLPLIAFASVSYIPVLLVLTVFVSVLMALSRAWKDSEMVIWLASGQSLTAWIAPVLSFAAPFVVLIGFVSFVVGPWAQRQSAEYRVAFEQREDIAQIAPGQFRESVAANRVFFVEDVDPDGGRVHNVFVTQTRNDTLTIVASTGGRIVTEPNGDRFLVLEQGRRYDGVWGKPEYRLMEFERYGVRIESRARPLTIDSSRVKSTPELLQTPTPRNLGELLWRTAQPVSAVLLALLAIPLSFVNPRAGRSMNLVVALLLYVAYNNLTSVMQAWVGQQRVAFVVGATATHLAIAALTAWLFWRRTSLSRFTLRRRPRAQPIAAAGSG